MITLISVYIAWIMIVLFSGYKEAEKKWHLNRTYWFYMVISMFLVIILSTTYGAISLLGFLSMFTMFPLLYSIKYWKLNKINKGSYPLGWKTKLPLPNSKDQTIDWKTKLVLAIVLNSLITGLMISL
jgi:hypothetical protein